MSAILSQPQCVNLFISAHNADLEFIVPNKTHTEIFDLLQATWEIKTIFWKNMNQLFKGWYMASICYDDIGPNGNKYSQIVSF